LAAGPASAASGDFDDVAAMSRRVAAGIAAMPAPMVGCRLVIA
jgi:hypothetical protein